MFGRKRDNTQPQPPAWQPMPPGQVRDPEAMKDTAPDPAEADSDDQYW